MKPVLAIAAWSGTGKTSLLKKLIPALYARGIRTGVIKHTHHNMDIDKPGKDSYELRRAGAAQTMVASAQRWWIGPYISIHFLSLNPLLVRRRRYSRGERYPSALCGCHSL